MQVEVFELFSGQARVSQVFREKGTSVVSYDILYEPSGRCMNFLKEGGFAQEAKLLCFICGTLPHKLQRYSYACSLGWPWPLLCGKGPMP